MIGSLRGGATSLGACDGIRGGGSTTTGALEFASKIYIAGDDNAVCKGAGFAEGPVTLGRAWRVVVVAVASKGGGVTTVANAPACSNVKTLILH